MSQAKLTEENFLDTVLTFQDRQAGVSLIYDGESEKYSYNAYCLELKLMKELFSCEFDYLSDALACIDQEFGTWHLSKLGDEKGCGSCAAKKT